MNVNWRVPPWWNERLCRWCQTGGRLHHSLEKVPRPFLASLQFPCVCSFRHRVGLWSRCRILASNMLFRVVRTPRKSREMQRRIGIVSFVSCQADTDQHANKACGVVSDVVTFPTGCCTLPNLPLFGSRAILRWRIFKTIIRHDD